MQNFARRNPPAAPLLHAHFLSRWTQKSCDEPTLLSSCRSLSFQVFCPDQQYVKPVLRYYRLVQFGLIQLRVRSEVGHERGGLQI